MGMYPGGNIIKVSPTISTDAYGTADLIFDKQEIKNVVPSRGGCSFLQNISLYVNPTGDIDIGILFFDNSTSIGANANEALTNIADGEFQAAGCIGSLNLDAGAGSVHMGNGRVYNSSRSSGSSGLPILLKAAEGETSIWFIAVTTSGTPTYAANGLDFTFNVQYLG
jgi:hypothetical protein|tara:strand:+ start:235 stop:735 length:501 start_codon:yes stop_codon:yes gene_type:complete